MSAHTNLIPLLLVGLLIAFSIYRRVRRMVGRQRVNVRAMTLRMLFFAVLCVFLLFWPHFKPVNALGYVAAGTIGAGLGFYALRKTQFDRGSDGGFFYTPRAYVGAAVVALFVGRIGYRLLGTYSTMAAVQAGQAPPPPNAAAALQNPLTVAFYFALAGYYICYYAGILRSAKESSDPSAS